jgi:hypothetical protein
MGGSGFDSSGRGHGMEKESCKHNKETYSFIKAGTFLTTVSDYGLDDRAIVVRSSAGVKDFYRSRCAQTGSEAHPASCPNGTGGPFPGCQARPERDADHLPHLMPRSRMRSYKAFLPCRLHGSSGTYLLFTDSIKLVRCSKSTATF